MAKRKICAKGIRMKTMTGKGVIVIEAKNEKQLSMKKFNAWQTYLLFILILSVFFITGCDGGTGAFKPSLATPTVPVVTAPIVVFTDPANGETGVAINRKIAATFSKDMNPSTINTTSFTVTGPGAAAVTGTVSYIGLIATFTPSANLANNTTYTATITTSARDLAGNGLAVNYVWSFTTGAAPDTTRPTVISTDPANGATGVPVNKKITATFSKSMDPLTLINTTTFTVGGVTGTVAYDPITRTATFTPSGNLAINTTYTATITTAALDLAGNGLAVNYVWSFTTAASPDITPTPDATRPTVTLTDPANGDTDVAVNRKIAATFSKAMNPSTITNPATFTLAGPGLTPISGTVSYAGLIATFTPSGNLASNTTYIATITTAASDLSGNTLAVNYVWSFTTGTALDTTPPTVTFTDPANGDTGVAINKKIAAIFSKAMDPLTLINSTTFTITGPGLTPVTGTVTYVGLVATFTPESLLTSYTTYTATITTAAKDLAGNAMAANYVWSFTTGAVPDITPPTVIFTDPANGDTGVAINTKIAATFSEPMDPLTMLNTIFTVAGVPGTVAYDPITRTATFTPGSILISNTTYTATITTEAKDLAGNPMAANYVWSFQTGPPPPWYLGAAAPFGSFGGGAGMTNEGLLTVVHGDIGTTGASTTITGFHDSVGDIYTETTLNKGTVTGRIYTAAPPPGGAGVGGNAQTYAIALAGANDALTAYNNLAGLAPTAPVVANLGGLTLPPGVYQAPSGSFLLTGSDLTLDGQGNANAVWVFQMSTSLTVGAAGPIGSRSVKLINGAKAKNVFWQVGSAATINPAGGGTMVGTIIAFAGVTISTTGNNAPEQIVTLNGRALGLNASVTVVNTIINVPAP